MIAGVSDHAGAEPAAPDEPRIGLVLVIVVDQLRGDMIEANVDRLGAGGFRRFLERGLVYRNAYMRFAPTSTGPGHATLATGALPPAHGIPGNEWRDRASGARVYCTADPGHALLDATTRRNDGTSPRNLNAETMVDALYRATSGRSRALAVSVKDRSAILMAGCKGRALWYLRRSGRLVSSDYYFRQPPGWLVEFNDARMPSALEASWELTDPPERYRFHDRDDQAWERDYEGLGRIFPHRLAETSDPAAAFRFLPLSDELTVELAIQAATEEGLGHGPAPDVLTLALSATDYVDHAFGPDSLEWEDNLIRLDALVARLLEWSDRHVGHGRTLIALSSDHGIPSAPEYLILGGSSAGRVDVPGMIAGLRDFLMDRFELEADPVLGAKMPGIYLDARVLGDADVDMEEAERVAAEYVGALDGVAAVLVRTDLLAGRVPDSRPFQRVLAGYHPALSGDLIVVQEEGWHLDMDPNNYAVALFELSGPPAVKSYNPDD